MPEVGISRILVKVSPKMTSQRAGWIPLVYSSVRAWRSFCSSTTHIATVRDQAVRSGSTDAGSRSASPTDISETSALLVQSASRDLAEDVLQRGLLAELRLERGRRVHGPDRALV